MEILSNIANTANGMQVIKNLIYEKDIVKRTITRESYAKLLGNCVMVQNAMHGPEEFNPFDENQCHRYEYSLEDNKRIVFQLNYVDVNDKKHGYFTSIVLHHMDLANNVPLTSSVLNVIFPFYLKCEPSQRTPDNEMFAIRGTNLLINQMDSIFGRMYDRVINGSSRRRRSHTSSSSENSEYPGSYLMRKFLFELNVSENVPVNYGEVGTSPQDSGSDVVDDFQADRSGACETEKS